MNIDAATAELLCKLRELCCDFSFKAFWAMVASLFSWAVGECGEPVAALVTLWALDFALGFALAWRGHAVNSGRFRSGVYKILLYALVIMAANLLDMAVGSIPFLDHPVRALFVCFLALGEFLSVCAHISVIKPGVLPKGLMLRVKRYRENMFATREVSS